METPKININSLSLIGKKTLLIMRTFLIFFIASTCLLHAADADSQTANVSLKVRNKSLADIVSEMEKSTGYYFFYNNEEVKLDKKISVSVENKSINVALDVIFKDTDIKYTLMDGNSIVLSVASQKVNQQKDEIIATGKVLDFSNLPLTGVSIKVKGDQKNGTVTDLEGNFSFNVPPNSILEISYIGFKKQQVKVTSGKRLVIRLEEDSELLDEVVVVGYGTLKKSDLTGAVVSIKSDEIMKIPSANVAHALVGKVAGLDGVQAGNDPGAGVNIQIRGRRSLTASNSPLFVVDGMPINDIKYVNPEEIESVEVLKDASSTAIYGSRGANGVIIISTKKGKSGKTTVSYNGYMGVVKATRKMEMMNGSQFAEMKRAANRVRRDNDNSRYLTSYPDPEEDRKTFGADPYALQSVLMAYEWEDAEMTKVKTDANGIPIYHQDRVRSTNWTDLYLRTGFEQKHSIAINAGNDKTRFMANLSYNSEEGVILQKDYQMASLRLNIEHDINKHLTFGAQTLSSYEVANTGANLYGQSPLQMNPLTSPYAEDGTMVQFSGVDPQLYNPMFHLEDIKRENRIIKTYGTVFARANDLFTNGLGLETRFSYDLSAIRKGAFQGSLSFDRRGAPATASNEYATPTRWVWDNLLSYNKKFSDNHRLNLVAGVSAEGSRSEHMSLAIRDMHYEHALFYNLGIGNEVTGKGGSYTEKSLLSYLARINYTLYERYLFTASGRYDGSSVLAKGNKWSFFPSAAVAWRANEEEFIKNLGVFDNLKLRLSYGVNGNSSIDPYQTEGGLRRTVYSWNNSDPAYGYAPGSLPLKNLKWERTTSFNLGIDFAIVDNRISGSVELYRQNTKDLLMTKTLPIVSGYGSVLDNIGKTRNEGIEVSLHSDNIVNFQGFSWSSSITFTSYKEKILELNGGQTEDIDRGWFVGKSLYSYYTYQQDGIWGNSVEELAAIAKFNANGSNFAPGKYRVIDQNGDDKINADDRVIIGSNKPAWYGSFENTFGYRDFDLSILMNARVGQRVNTDLYERQLVSPTGRTNVLNLDYWREDNQGAKYTAARYDQAIVDYGNGTASIVKGSFLKVRTITLGYTIPKRLLKGVNIRAYGTAYNPFLLTNFDFIDPESSAGTGTPSTKKFVFGLNVTF